MTIKTSILRASRPPSRLFFTYDNILKFAWKVKDDET